MAEESKSTATEKCSKMATASLQINKPLSSSIFRVCNLYPSIFDYNTRETERGRTMRKRMRDPSPCPKFIGTTCPGPAFSFKFPNSATSFPLFTILPFSSFSYNLLNLNYCSHLSFETWIFFFSLLQY